MKEEIFTISENNRFHVHRVDIANVCKAQDKDVGVGAKIWAQENNIENHKEEYEEFIKHVSLLQRLTTEKDNRVAAYFRGE